LLQLYLVPSRVAQNSDGEFRHRSGRFAEKRIFAEIGGGQGDSFIKGFGLHFDGMLRLFRIRKAHPAPRHPKSIAQYFRRLFAIMAVLPIWCLSLGPRKKELLNDCKYGH
jgi:hypothetical protein